MDVMERMGSAGRTLGAALMARLVLMGCATSRRMAEPAEPDPEGLVPRWRVDAATS
jgi:hypothetical protein